MWSHICADRHTVQKYVLIYSYTSVLACRCMAARKHTRSHVVGLCTHPETDVRFGQTEYLRGQPEQNDEQHENLTIGLFSICLKFNLSFVLQLNHFLFHSKFDWAVLKSKNPPKCKCFSAFRIVQFVSLAVMQQPTTQEASDDLKCVRQLLRYFKDIQTISN